jgi:hypothetical protein
MGEEDGFADEEEEEGYFENFALLFGEAFDEVSEALKKHKEDKIFKMDGPVDAKAKEPDPNAAKRVKRTDEDLLILALAARLC